jgi:hypothetical protein
MYSPSIFESAPSFVIIESSLGNEPENTPKWFLKNLF